MMRLTKRTTLTNGIPNIFIIGTVVVLLFVSFKSFALDYTISFTGAGASSTVDSVIVQNLRQGTTIIVPPGNCLNLSDIPNSIDQLKENEKVVRIFPNPLKDKSTVSFFVLQTGSVQINVFSIDGKKIVGTNMNLSVGENSFQLSLPKGAYVIRIAGNGYSYAAKVISQADGDCIHKIEFVGNEETESSIAPKMREPVPLRSSNVTTMLYNEGDCLLFKGVSGNFSTIVTDIPTQNKMITFSFVKCIDADGNHYSVVTIGNQIWMVENLKTTKYNDGTSIPKKTDGTAWYNLTTPGYCFYNNDDANKTTYGALYNWYTVNTGKLAPTGWHVPTDAEWTKLENYLIANGYNYDGTTTGNMVAKSLAATTGWLTSTNTGAIGNDLTKNNTSGFAGLPGGYRYYNGTAYSTKTFASIDGSGGWWSSSENGSYYAWYRILSCNDSNVFRLNNYKKYGFSVRCVCWVDNTPVFAAPILSTTSANNIKTTSATCGGTITNNGGAPITANGVCWSTSTTPTTENNKTTDGTTSGSFTSTINGLTANTMYYVRAYATNSVGTAYGNEVNFYTQNGVVSLATTTAYAITPFTGTSRGSISSDGGAPVTERGVCWNTSPSPTTANNKTANGSGIGSYMSSISGLTPGTTYYVRSYATNSFGTAYGNEVSFTTATSSETVADIDGNVYTTVTIGTQTWMVENLKTTKYNDGTSIHNITDDISWLNLSTPGYCFYNNDDANKTTYGTLYNWYTVYTGKLAPTGWHIPTDAEWTTLENYLIAHGYNYDGTTTDNKLAKSLAANTGWNSYSGTGTIGNDLTNNNTSGFAGIPGGYRSNSGTFTNVGFYGYWWSSTMYSPYGAWYRALFYDYRGVYRSDVGKQCGFSVRCVRDY